MYMYMKVVCENASALPPMWPGFKFFPSSAMQRVEFLVWLTFRVPLSLLSTFSSYFNTFACKFFSLMWKFSSLPLSHF